MNYNHIYMKHITYKEVKKEANGNTAEKTITRSTNSVEQFYRAYSHDIGQLLKCTKGEIDFIVCLLSLKFVEYNTNEIVLNAQRRDAISTCSGLKHNSLYNFTMSLKKKGIIVDDKDGKMHLNPALFFFGSDHARAETFKLVINYKIHR